MSESKVEANIVYYSKRAKRTPIGQHFSEARRQRGWLIGSILSPAHNPPHPGTARSGAGVSHDPKNSSESGRSSPVTLERRRTRSGLRPTDREQMTVVGSSAASRRAATTWTRSGPIRSPRCKPAGRGVGWSAIPGGMSRMSRGRGTRRRHRRRLSRPRAVDPVVPCMGQAVAMLRRRRVHVRRSLCTSSVGVAAWASPSQIAMDTNAETARPTGTEFERGSDQEKRPRSRRNLRSESFTNSEPTFHGWTGYLTSPYTQGGPITARKPGGETAAIGCGATGVIRRVT